MLAIGQEYVTKNPYGEVRFKELVKVREPQDATFSFGNKRYAVTGQLVADLVTNSYKWGDQIALNVWVNDLPKIEARPDGANHKVTRIAIALSPRMARRFCEELLKKLWELGF